MPLQHPEPPTQVAELVTGKLHLVGEQAPSHLTALGGSQPADMTPTDVHEVYVLGLEDLISSDDSLVVARPAGWRYLLSDQGRAVSSAWTTLTDGGEHRFAMFNSGPYVSGTSAALHDASNLSEVATEEMVVRLLSVPALNFTALWLHGAREDLLLPLAPAPGAIEPQRPYPAGELLATLRELASPLVGIGPDDETGS